MESIRQKQVWCNELMQPGWGDAANFFRENDMKYGTAELNVRGAVNYQIDIIAVPRSTTPFEEPTQTVEIVRGQSHMPPVTSGHGRRHMRLGSVKPQSDSCIRLLSAVTQSDLTLIPNMKPVEPTSFYPCMKHP
jgi:hypothetical protein